MVIHTIREPVFLALCVIQTHISLLSSRTVWPKVLSPPPRRRLCYTYPFPPTYLWPPPPIITTWVRRLTGAGGGGAQCASVGR